MASHRSMRKSDVERLLSPRVLMDLPEVTLRFAHAMISASSTFSPPFNDASKSIVERRISCHITAKMSFLLPSAMSRPPMFTSTKSIFLPTATTWLPFSTTWCRFFGSFRTFFHGTMPCSMWSITDKIGRPLQSSLKRSLICSVSSADVGSLRFNEFTHSLNVRASRVSPASSRSNSASSFVKSSSSASNGFRPWQSLNNWAVNAKFSFALPEATSRALMNGDTPRDSAFARTADARCSRSPLGLCGSLFPYSCRISVSYTTLSESSLPRALMRRSLFAAARW
mmetsp:Transcript_2882/g.8678  ORF Transcript_2882/g.8678 Transcript_2882/m.8678 type:complete len:283 (+) Transcript_2882:561-1409(+)